MSSTINSSKKTKAVNHKCHKASSHRQRLYRDCPALDPHRGTHSRTPLPNRWRPGWQSIVSQRSPWALPGAQGPRGPAIVKWICV